MQNIISIRYSGALQNYFLFYFSRKKISWFRYIEQALRCSVGLSGDVADQSCWFCVWWPISQHAGIILSSSNNRETSEVFTDPAAWGLIFLFFLFNCTMKLSHVTSDWLHWHVHMCLCAVYGRVCGALMFSCESMPLAHDVMENCIYSAKHLSVIRIVFLSCWQDWPQFPGQYMYCVQLLFFHPDVSLEILYFIFRCL